MNRRALGVGCWMALSLILPLPLPRPAEASPPTFELDSDPSKIVLVFDESIGGIAQPDPIPRLRIYAGGLAKIHVPAYMQGSGDYTLRLDPLRLRAVLRRLVSAGLVDLDDRKIREHRHRLGTHRDAAGHPRRRTDRAAVQIEIRLARFAGRGAVRRKLHWTGLRGDARDFPNDSLVRDMAQAVDGLWGICHDPGLQADPGASR